MMRLVLLLLGVALAVNAQVGEMVTINGRTYFMGNDVAGVDYNAAENVCLNQTMSLVGFELTGEMGDLTNWFRTNRKTGQYWTNGIFDSGTNLWQWGTSGVTWDNKDGTWSQNPIKEPDGDALLWDSERISFGAVLGKIHSEAVTELNHVMCE